MTSYRVAPTDPEVVRAQHPSYAPATHIAVPAALVDDTHLSYEARGLWTYLQTLPAGTLITAAAVAQHGPDSVESVAAALLELADAGWLHAGDGDGDGEKAVTA